MLSESLFKWKYGNYIDARCKAFKFVREIKGYAFMECFPAPARYFRVSFGDKEEIRKRILESYYTNNKHLFIDGVEHQFGYSVKFENE